MLPLGCIFENLAIKTFEILVEGESAETPKSLLVSLPYMKQVHQKQSISGYTLASEKVLSEDWLSEEDDGFKN